MKRTRAAYGNSIEILLNRYKVIQEMPIHDSQLRLSGANRKNKRNAVET